MMGALQLMASRAILLWGAQSRRITWHLYNHLMRDVIRRERMMVACAGKRAFLTFDHATWVATHRTGKDGHEPRKAYHCRVCGAFHLATLTQEDRNARLRMKERMHA